MVFNCRLVATLGQVQTAELFLTRKEITRMKVDSKSSATMVCDRIFDPNLYRLGLLSRDRSRRLSSIPTCLSFRNKGNGSV